MGNLAGQLARALPPSAQPLIPNIIAGLHQTEAQAIGELFWLTLVGAVAALVCALLIRPLPLRGGPSLRQEEAAQLAAA